LLEYNKPGSCSPLTVIEKQLLDELCKSNFCALTEDEIKIFWQKNDFAY
jgi:hypothetical protein